MRHLDGKSIMVIDDEVDLLEVLCTELLSQGAKVTSAQSGDEGIKLFQHKPVDLIISDIQMKQGSGLDLLKAVKAIHPVNPLVFLMTGYSEVDLDELYDQGASAVFSKPFALGDLIALSSRFLLSLEVKWYQSSKLSKNVDIKIDLDNAQNYLGQGGIFLPTTTAYPLQQELSFEINFQEGSIKKLRGLGRVLWSKKNHGLGLEFASLETESLDNLINSVKNHPPRWHIPKQKKSS